MSNQPASQNIATHRTESVELSVVIPLFNEELVVDELLKRLLATITNITDSCEIILIDDGSTDQTLTKLLLAQKNEKRIRVVQLSKNFGHQAAFTAGLSIAKGDAIVMLDGDLQDPPELIKELYDKLQSDEVLDVVYAKRNSRKEKASRGFLTKVFHKIFKKILRSESIDNVGNFAIFRSTVKDAILSYSEKTRYLPGIRVHVGFNQDSIGFDRDERFAGKTKMSLSKLFSLSLDAIFSFSNFPIRLMLIIGIGGLVISFLGIIYILISKISGVAPFGWSSTVMFILFFGSLNLAFMGILGEYVHRIYKESQNRPLFIIKNIIQD